MQSEFGCQKTIGIAERYADCRKKSKALHIDECQILKIGPACDQTEYHIRDIAANCVSGQMRQAFIRKTVQFISVHSDKWIMQYLEFLRNSPKTQLTVLAQN